MKRLGSFAVLLLFAAAVFAQEQTVAIEGVITDPSGAALPGVSVEAVRAGGPHFTSVTDSKGLYRFPSVPPGIYTITATLSGMLTATLRPDAMPRGRESVRVGSSHTKGAR